MLLQNYDAADIALMNDLCQKDIPTAKALVLHQFHEVIQNQIKLRDSGEIFKSKKDFEDFMSICLRHYKTDVIDQGKLRKMKSDGIGLREFIS